MPSFEELMFDAVYAQLRSDIISGSTATLKFKDPIMTECLTQMILDFLEMLRNRLPIGGLTYLNLISFRNNDLALYGDKMVQYLKKAKGVLNLHEETLKGYELLIRKYLTFIPIDLQELRTKLMIIRAQQIEESQYLINFNDVECQIDYNLVTYHDVNPSLLSGTIQQQIDHFICQIRQPTQARENLHRLVDLLNRALQSSELAEFGPKLLPFGSLLTGLATFSSDLDLVVKFEKVNLDVIDFDTSLLALEVIRPIINEKLGFEIGEKFIFPSRRCPIVTLKFEFCLPKYAMPANDTSLRFNRCDISIRQMYSYYNSKLLEFLVKYDYRFYEMAMLLKYWAKKCGLIHPELISTFGLYMMIAYLLQNTTPPILPTIERLQELAKLQPNKPPIKVHLYDFAFCDDIEMIGRNKNITTTKDLLIQFIEFYKNFDFRQFVVSPRLGQPLDKTELYEKHTPNNLSDTSSPFKRTFVAIEDPFVWDNNCGGIFHTAVMNKWRDAFGEASYRIRVNPNDIVQILTKPNRTHLAIINQRY